MTNEPNELETPEIREVPNAPTVIQGPADRGDNPPEIEQPSIDRGEGDE